MRRGDFGALFRAGKAWVFGEKTPEISSADRAARLKAARLKELAQLRETIDTVFPDRRDLKRVNAERNIHTLEILIADGIPVGEGPGSHWESEIAKVRQVCVEQMDLNK